MYSQLVSSSTRIPLPQESFLERISYSLNHFREVYSLFPCSDKLMVEKLFNIFNEVRAPKIPERLETEEAEVGLFENWRKYLRIYVSNIFRWSYFITWYSERVQMFRSQDGILFLRRLSTHLIDVSHFFLQHIKNMFNQVILEVLGWA